MSRKTYLVLALFVVFFGLSFINTMITDGQAKLFDIFNPTYIIELLGIFGV